MKRLLTIIFVMMVSVQSPAVLLPIKHQEEYVAGVIYTEALRQSDYAKGLVATTIWIRAGGDPNKIHEVCTIPKQFAQSQKSTDPEWQNCLSYARRLIRGTFTPLAIQHPSGDWVHPDHFLQTKLLKSKDCPSWAKGKWHKKVDDLSFLMLGKYRITKD